MPVPKFCFEVALLKLKKGLRLAREGWNGRGMFIFLVAGSVFNVNRAPLNQFFPDGTEITYRPHIDMKAGNGDIVVWTASQSDVLAEDWYVVE